MHLCWRVSDFRPVAPGASPGDPRTRLGLDGPEDSVGGNLTPLA